MGKKKQAEEMRTVEQRLRRTLQRRGYRLIKSRRRDPHALTFGRDWIIGERVPIDRGTGNLSTAKSSKDDPHLISVYLIATKGDRTRDFTMTLDEVDALCSPESNAFAPISQKSYYAAKADCLLALEAYESERRETVAASRD
jgi:hypothetical protein